MGLRPHPRLDETPKRFTSAVTLTPCARAVRIASSSSSASYVRARRLGAAAASMRRAVWVNGPQVSTGQREILGWTFVGGIVSLSPNVGGHN